MHQQTATGLAATLSTLIHHDSGRRCHMIANQLERLYHATPPQVWAFFLIANVGIFAGSAATCWIISRMFRGRQVLKDFQPFSLFELAAALVAVFLNAAVSVGGWYLWTAGWIQLTEPTLLRTIIDTAAMLIFMDIVMYVGHRLVHIPAVYPIVHRFHHRHETTNPISLFVLHPLEVAGFGSAMIVFLMIYPMSPIALIIYLNLNVIFGTLGHSGVEPFPEFLSRIPLLNMIGTSTFHAEHHEDQRYNFGFYTLVWDYLFGTLEPDYWQRYRNPVRYREQKSRIH